MIKLTFVLLSSFWLSCGNNSEKVQNKTIASEEKTETVMVKSSDTVPIHDTVVVSEKISVNEESAEDEKVAMEEPILSVETPQEKVEAKEKAITLPNHTLWNTLLGNYVNEKGDVNYSEFLKNVSSLDQYLNHLAKNSPKKDWSKNEKLAYYINLYNAATVKLILDNYPTKSIKDIKNPWGKDWVKTGDGLLSLGDIEHKILRKMDEPRIHFAINCASFSCPKLLNVAFTANQMEDQLHQVATDFINDETRNSISKEKIQLSNIFKWYKKDFTENGSLAAYIKRYSKTEISENIDIDYLKYDWNLNEAK